MWRKALTRKAIRDCRNLAYDILLMIILLSVISVPKKVTYCGQLVTIRGPSSPSSSELILLY